MAKHKFTKRHKSFSELHGSKSGMFNNQRGVTPEMLGHDQQINPPTPGGSPLQDPTNPGRLGMAMGHSPGDEESM